MCVVSVELCPIFVIINSCLNLRPDINLSEKERKAGKRSIQLHFAIGALIKFIRSNSSGFTYNQGLLISGLYVVVSS